MTEKPDTAQESDRVAIPLDPEEALRVLLQVDPESEPVGDSPKEGDVRSRNPPKADG